MDLKHPEQIDKAFRSFLRARSLKLATLTLTLPQAFDAMARSGRSTVIFKWDMDVVRHVLPAGTWSFVCWDAAGYDAFKAAVEGTPAFATMRTKQPAETRISLERAASRPDMLRPPPDVRQMWWGVM
jgi:hypothetical protein